jgi:lipopolysaccharide export system protein LptA
MSIRAFVLVVLTLAYSSVALAAQETTSPTGESFKADRLERLADNLMRATGNVEVKGRGFQLRADSVELRRAPGGGDASVEFVAEGNVVLTRGSDRLVVQRLQFNPATGSGVFQLPQGKH